MVSLIVSGVEPMGLFWSMIQEPWQNSHWIMKDDVTTPLDSHISVITGVVPEHRVLSGRNALLCSVVCHRYYMAEGVTRTEVTAGRVRGTLFIPPGMKSCSYYLHVTKRK